MRKHVCFTVLLFIVSHVVAFAQSDSLQRHLILVPYVPYMYFSDADEHLSKHNGISQQAVREHIRNYIESNTYHQLLARFQAHSLMRATTITGEDELRKVYGSTRFVKYNSAAYELSEKGLKAQNYTRQLSKKRKEQFVFTQDTNVMVAVFDDKEFLSRWAATYNQPYIVFLTQFEIITSGKNQLEWQYRDYTREYWLHYNIFDAQGNLLRAEVLIVKAGGDNKLADIDTKYLAKFSEWLKLIMVSIE